LLHSLVEAYQEKAQMLTHRNDLTGATTIQTECLDLAEQLVSKAPSTSSRTSLSFAHKKLGALLIAQNKYAQALSEYQAAQSLDELLLATHPDDANARFAITFTYSDIGYIDRKQGNLDAALTNYQKVLGIREALAKADPHDDHAISGVARTCGYIGNVFRDQGKPQEALHYHLRELAILEQQSLREANNHQLGADIASASWDVGDDYLAIAEARKGDAERVHHLNLAQHYLLRAQAAMADAKAHGLLYGNFLDATEKIKQDLAKCVTLLHASHPGISVDSTSAHNP
jgi:tetratricopeptide (TPR) repeat protein